MSVLGIEIGRIFRRREREGSLPVAVFCADCPDRGRTTLYPYEVLVFEGMWSEYLEQEASVHTGHSTRVVDNPNALFK